MPIYTYECRSCRHEWDEIRNMRDGNKSTVCDVCDGLDVRKIIKGSYSFSISGQGVANPGWRGASRRKKPLIED